jgi:F-type H+-transporting ATPase subunit gamma
MANVKELKKRIKSTKSTHKITSAMKLVSAAKLSKIQQRVLGMRPYSEEIFETIKTVSAIASEYSHQYFEKNDNPHKVLIVISSSKGLCGSYNNQLSKVVTSYIEKNPTAKIIFIGTKVKELIKVDYNEGEIFDHKEIQADESFLSGYAKGLADLFSNGEVGEINIAYNAFYSAMNCEPTIDKVLPIELDQEELKEIKSSYPFDFKYEPGANEILDVLVPEVYEDQFTKAWLDSQASEHGMRMVAMDNASKNCNEMIKNLTLKMNKIRQAAITTELIEVVSGAESLKG